MSPHEPEELPGQESNLSLHAYECGRCGEPMLHLCELWATYPLARWWRLTCGECGSELDGWEEVPTTPRWLNPAPETE